MCDVSITIEHRDVHAPLTSPSNSMVKNSIIDGRINRILSIVMTWYVKFWTLLPCCTPPLKGLLRAFPALSDHTYPHRITIKFSLYLTINHCDVDVEPPSHISTNEQHQICRHDRSSPQKSRGKKEKGRTTKPQKALFKNLYTWVLKNAPYHDLFTVKCILLTATN